MSATLTLVTPVPQVSTPSSPVSGSIDVGSGSGRQIALFIPVLGTAPNVSAVSVGGTALSEISGTNVTAINAGVRANCVAWGGALPDALTGTQSVSISFSGSPYRFTCYGYVAAGADLINHGTGNTDILGNAVAVALTSDQGGDVTAWAATEYANVSPTSSPTYDFHEANGTLLTQTQIGQAGSGATITVSRGANQWTAAAMSGVNFRAAAGSAGLQPGAGSAVLAPGTPVRVFGTVLIPGTP